MPSAGEWAEKEGALVAGSTDVLCLGLVGNERPNQMGNNNTTQRSAALLVANRFICLKSLGYTLLHMTYIVCGREAQDGSKTFLRLPSNLIYCLLTDQQPRGFSAAAWFLPCISGPRAMPLAWEEWQQLQEHFWVQITWLFPSKLLLLTMYKSPWFPPGPEDHPSTCPYFRN